jgi:3-oxoadipate enol-lactonase
MSYVALNNQEIFYEDSATNGFPVVMMHGFLFDQKLFDPQVQVLASKYRCVRFDARAFGKTRWDGKAFTLYDTARDCIALMNHLDIKQAVIVGMSQGGYTALRLALGHPERVRALVLMSTRAGNDNEETKAQYKTMRDTWKSVGPIEPLIEGLATALLGPKEAPNMTYHWHRWLPQWKARTGDEIFHAMNNLIDRDDISSQVANIKAPTLVTHGSADIGIPLSCGEELKRLLPNSYDLIVAPGAAHAANYTHADIINPALINFLDAVVK